MKERIPLFVTAQDFAEIMEWSILPPGEFVARMLGRWPHTLADRLYGPPVPVVVVPDVLTAITQWQK